MQDPRVIPAAERCTRISTSMRGPRIASGLSAAIGLLTLALACLGIFGVVSYGVALRTKEIGIRVALGAQQPALLRAIVRQVLTPVFVGVAIGILLAIPAAMVLQSEPFYLENADPIAFAAALAVFGAAGAVAALWPAFQVLRSNPVDALRALVDHRRRLFRRPSSSRPPRRSGFRTGERILARITGRERPARSIPWFALHRQPRIVDRRMRKPAGA